MTLYRILQHVYIIPFAISPSRPLQYKTETNNRFWNVREYYKHSRKGFKKITWIIVKQILYELADASA